ncbi:hypothetical protein MTY_1192 [Moorella thermoacetica Y72]|uniref:Uncharacterized protein n=1 Tax=Moorella thermoacetica Y72 TaxID=1325331 RepID=A0A0S6UBL8_NEOTH|nr:hypothetical protein MTY_1192 [Moorella thermoacetica Y72]
MEPLAAARRSRRVGRRLIYLPRLAGFPSLAANYILVQ